MQRRESPLLDWAVNVGTPPSSMQSSRAKDVASLRSSVASAGATGEAAETGGRRGRGRGGVDGAVNVAMREAGVSGAALPKDLAADQWVTLFNRLG